MKVVSPARTSVPTLVPKKKPDRIVLPGDVPSPMNPPSGCRFHPRCPLAMDVCKHEQPRQLNLDGHIVYCHAVEQELGKMAKQPQVKKS